MKNLFAFTLVFAAGFLLGSRQARKTVVVVSEFRLRGADFMAIAQQQGYRSKVTEAEPALCRADIDALQARQHAGELLTKAELETLYKYQKTA